MDQIQIFSASDFAEFLFDAVDTHGVLAKLNEAAVFASRLNLIGSHGKLEFSRLKDLIHSHHELHRELLRPEIISRFDDTPNKFPSFEFSEFWSFADSLFLFDRCFKIQELLSDHILLLERQVLEHWHLNLFNLLLICTSHSNIFNSRLLIFLFFILINHWKLFCKRMLQLERKLLLHFLLSGHYFICFLNRGLIFLLNFFDSLCDFDLFINPHMLGLG